MPNVPKNNNGLIEPLGIEEISDIIKLANDGINRQNVSYSDIEKVLIILKRINGELRDKLFENVKKAGVLGIVYAGIAMVMAALFGNLLSAILIFVIPLIITILFTVTANFNLSQYISDSSGLISKYEKKINDIVNFEEQKKLLHQHEIEQSKRLKEVLSGYWDSEIDDKGRSSITSSNKKTYSQDDMSDELWRLLNEEDNDTIDVVEHSKHR